MNEPSPPPFPLPTERSGPYRTPAARPPEPPPTDRSLARALRLGFVATLLVPMNLVLVGELPKSWGLFLVLSSVQLGAGFASAGFALIHISRKDSTRSTKAGAWLTALWGTLVGLGGGYAVASFVASFVAFLAALGKALGGAGGAWGRPLRLRGRILHPELRFGSDWTRGGRPSVEGLDTDTRTALEALWLHDAQKEHASVPAFARIGWQLAAVGAPAELLEGAHRAALEEIDHARRCFALAAGYGGQSHSVEPMPDLLVGGLDLHGDPLEKMAVESLKDGCLLEDFNADVAARCAEVCEDPAVKDVLLRIAREERSHAEFSWQVLAWLLERGGDRIRRAIERAIAKLAAVERPTAVSAEKRPLVQRADPIRLQAHGRLPDEAWAPLWHARLEATQDRAKSMVSPADRAAAPRAG